MLTRGDVLANDLWSVPSEDLFKRLKTSEIGISEMEARTRHTTFGPNELAAKKRRRTIVKFLLCFANPLIALALVVGAVSYLTGNLASAVIIGAMILISGTITFFQENKAEDAASKLRKLIRNTAAVIRGGIEREIPIKHLVPGDMVSLSAGDMVPADCRIITCKDFFVNQASLTGESLPVEKTSAVSKPKAGLSDMKNAAFFGSSVVSGSAEALVVRTGLDTQFGNLSIRLSRPPAETAFDRGIRDYSMLMVKFVVVLVFLIFFINVFLKNNFIEAVLFALAVAIGLTPEMLPAIVAANLSQGATNMARKEVIVKKLPSIQNLGAMDVLCTDKTGTLTEDKIVLVRHVNLDGEEDDRVMKLAFLNSHYHTGLRNPMDSAILEHDVAKMSDEVACFKKIDEVPFDFARRRMSVVVESEEEGRIMLTKGAPEFMLPLCASIHHKGRHSEFSDKHREEANELYKKLSMDGFRVLTLASRKVSQEKRVYGVADENEMTFEGFLAFFDPPKETVHTSLAEMVKRGIEIKIISGDNELVNQKIAKDVGLEIKGIIIGEAMEKATNESLQILVEKNTIFARVSPVQKERIIVALQRNGHVVGFLGDGINDALALKTSDVGISVDSAVDVAKEAADIILLKKSLHTLYEGVDEGRRTFANIMKYLKMGSSSNFGNMFSVVGASIFLPFLPMQPVQILLNNFLYDMSQLGIPTDRVDPEALLKPAKWKINEIKNFVIYMGPISSIYDYLTYGTLFFLLKVPPNVFHAGWFIESLMTQTLVIHVIRTNKIPFVQSRSSKRLLFLSLLIVSIGLFIVTDPVRSYFGFGELPPVFFPILAVFVLTYLSLTQFVKAELLKRGIIQ